MIYLLLLHEGLQYMDIWHYEAEGRIENINKFQSYFREKYVDKDYVQAFEDLVVDYYKEELKHN